MRHAPSLQYTVINGEIHQRTLRGWAPISKARARLLSVFYRSEAIKHEPDAPTFADHCHAMFIDLHKALTDLRAGVGSVALMEVVGR